MLNASEYRRRTSFLFASSEADDERAAADVFDGVAGSVLDVLLQAVAKQATATSPIQGRVFRYLT